MRKIKIAIPFLLLVIVLAGASCQDSDKEEKEEKERKEFGIEEEKKEEKKDYLVYENKSWNFEISYPKSWKEELIANEHEGVAVGFLSPSEGEKDTFQENIVVVASEPNPTGSFDEIMEEAMERLKGYEYGELITSSKKTIAGYPGYELIYTDSYDKNTKKQIHSFIDSGTVWYQILYTAKEESFVKYLPEAKIIINSFKVIK